MNRVAFTLFGHEVYWYGILIMLAVLIGTILAQRKEKQLSLPKDTAFDFVILCVPLAIICARIYYVIFSWDVYKDNLLSVFDIHRGGLAIYGGVIGGAISAIITAKRKSISFGSIADMTAVSLVLGQAIGRWGNYINQEAYGALITDARYCFFPVGVYIEALQEWHYAAFFYESAWCAIIALLLSVLFCKKRLPKRSGDLFLWYVVLYSAERAVVEGLRTDSLYFGSIRISQLLSIVAILFVCFLFFRRARKGVFPFVCAAAAMGVELLHALCIIQIPFLYQLILCLLSLLSAAGIYAKCKESSVWQS